MKRLLLIVNPFARRVSERKIEKINKILKERGYFLETLYTHSKGDGTLLAKQVEKSQNKIYAILVAGGDGTINEVANGLTDNSIPLLILPLGSENLLAKELNIPFKIEKAIDLLERKPSEIFLGKARIEKESETIIRYFLLMIGVGFDAMVVKDVRNSIKKIDSRFAHLYSFLKNFTKYSPQPMKIFIDDEEFIGFNAIICKSSLYGGIFRMSKDAKLKESSIYMVVFKGSDRFSLLKDLYRVYKETHYQSLDILYKKVSKVKILDKNHIQIDGDYLGKGKLEIEESSKTLKFFS